MKNFLPYKSIAVVGILTVAAGIMQGRMSNRWGLPSVSAAAALKLVSLPEEFGNWQMRQSHDLGKNVEDMLQCSGYINRTYINNINGETIQVAILLGPPGPISVHTPEVCYSSRNYTILHKRQNVSINTSDGSEESFWSLEFQESGLEGLRFQTFYAWNAGEHWIASENPRFQFAGKEYLYKIQLASRPKPSSGTEKEYLCKEFLREFIPELKPYLIKPPSA